MSNVIENKKFDKERELYNSYFITLLSCEFIGQADGESPLKESRNISLDNVKFYLRYPLWHNLYLDGNNVYFDSSSRAALWYDRHVSFQNSIFNGVKPFRQCEHIDLKDCKMNSEEAIWRCKDIKIDNCDLESFYFCLECKDIEIKNSTFKGKYSFQYCKNVLIENCTLDTKDFLWHAKNVVIKDCLIKGEYLGWYSSNVTLINCKIIGTQPLCYCNNLKLINCTMENCDLAFEYSFVKADINSKIDSIKNPLGGYINCLEVGSIINTDSKYKGDCKINVKK